ncbi:hypothetical protein V8B55DRAFT_1327113, partial [Mucor lusitanicus]
EVELQDDNDLHQGIKMKKIRDALSSYYQRRASDPTIEIVGPIKFTMTGRAWLEDEIVLTSRYHANRNKEFRRAGYYAYFSITYLNSRFVSQTGWFVGEVLWFMRHEYS